MKPNTIQLDEQGIFTYEAPEKLEMPSDYGGNHSGSYWKDVDD